MSDIKYSRRKRNKKRIDDAEIKNSGKGFNIKLIKGGFKNAERT